MTQTVAGEPRTAPLAWPAAGGGTRARRVVLKLSGEVFGGG
jgi:hypothetical protein